MGKTVGLETLHAPAFVVHTNQQVAANLLDVPAQGRELHAVLPVAGKQDQSAHQRVPEALAIHFAQGQASDVDDEGGVKSHGRVSGRSWVCYAFNSCLRILYEG